MVHPNTRSRQADTEDLDNQRPSGRPQRTAKAPQVFTFTSPNNNDSSSPSKPSAKKKRKKRKKPSERSAQENLEAMRESRARNLPPSSDEDDDLHKKPSALDLGVFTQYSADQDDVSDSNGGGGDSSVVNPPTTTSLLRTKTPAALMMTLPLEMTLMVKVQWCLKQWLAETVTLRDPTGSGMH
jgi:hypothetical protein